MILLTAEGMVCFCCAVKDFCSVSRVMDWCILSGHQGTSCEIFGCFVKRRCGENCLIRSKCLSSFQVLADGFSVLLGAPRGSLLRRPLTGVKLYQLSAPSRDNHTSIGTHSRLKIGCFKLPVMEACMMQAFMRRLERKNL
ncbi:hypothetical protein NC651_020260 [Populus alba x Populus x berolinensis]|nr:hypothetical protein NC651_020260 [Populus alba x Populus x berolinensis]